jgi:hypothetical protein
MTKKQFSLLDEGSEDNQSLLDNQDSSDTRQSLISSDQLSDAEIMRKQIDFLSEVAKNGNVIFEVFARNINDEEKKIKINSMKGYGMHVINVEKIDLVRTRGYVRVNDIDIPLLNTKDTKMAPWYLFNKEDAIAKVDRLNQLEYDRIEEEEHKAEEILNNVRMAKEYMREIITKGLV